MAHIDTHKCMNLDSNKQQTVTDHNRMEHISLTHAQYMKAIRIVSVYLHVAAYKRYTKKCTSESA
jgi:hypothetical protein